MIVVGIGINTNVENEKIKEISEIATTLKSLFNININNDVLLDAIITNIEILNDRKNILSIVRNNMAYLNEKRFISQINKEAIIKGIDDDGYLIVNDKIDEYKISGGTI